LSRSGGNIGIGFAISSNMVRSVTNQLIKYGQVKRGVLGINIYDVTPDIAKEYGLADASGALVAGVVQSSAAEKAGVKTGDIVTAIDGHIMKSAAELRRTIGMLRVGDKVEVSLLRDGKPLTVTALIAERSDTESGSAAVIHKTLEGAELADAPGGGVSVKSVQEGSPAAQAGLHANDLIVGVGRTPIANLKAFRDAAKDATLLLLNVRRGSQVLLIPIR
jgi:S1-C subfamily serine protease